MKTPSILMTLFSTSSTASILLNMTNNSTEEPSPWLNSSSGEPIRSSDIGMSCFIMTVGAISNLSALGILAKTRVRFRRQSKTPFLLLAVALLLADLGGHVILGTFALYLHMDKGHKMQVEKPTTFCLIYGTSMVFFGLCPLLLGCVMAMERYVAITQPFFHSAVISVTHVWRVVLVLPCLALVLAVPPLFSVGTYTIQSPGTWCFLPIHGPHSTADKYLTVAFACLGLTALTLSLLCNILSALALLWARIKPHKVNIKPTTCYGHQKSSLSTSPLFCSLDVEMMAQLALTTLVSCVCWAPFLIHILVMQFNQNPGAAINQQERFALLSLRMASWNQILNPWVYILLRRAVIRRVCGAFYTHIK